MQRELFISRQRVVCVCECVCGTLTRTAANGNHHGRRRIGRRAFLDDVRRFDLVDGAHELVHRDGFQRPSRGLRPSGPRLTASTQGSSLGPQADKDLARERPIFEAPIHLIPADTNGQEGGRPSAGTGAGRGRPTSNLVRRRGESRSSSRRSQEKGRDAPAAAVAATCSAAARERDGAAARLGVRSRFGRARAAKDAAREIPREVSVGRAIH